MTSRRSKCAANAASESGCGAFTSKGAAFEECPGMLCFRRTSLRVIVAVWLLSAASCCSSTGWNFFGFCGGSHPPGPAPAPGVAPGAGPGQGQPPMPGADNTSARTTPPITGNQLALKPDESATQRALELAQRLTEAQEEKKTLVARTRNLEAELAEKERALAASTREVQAATDEVRRTK